LAIAGDPKYCEATLEELVMARGETIKGAFLSKITRCPKSDDGTCDRPYYANSLCKVCYNKERGFNPNEHYTPETKAKRKANELTPERRRAKTLSGRRVRYVATLVDSPTKLTRAALDLMAKREWSDITAKELPKHLDSLWKAYNTAWETKHASPPKKKPPTEADAQDAALKAKRRGKKRQG
jgi:hypothetical protein